MRKQRNRYTPCTIPEFIEMPSDWSGLVVNATHFLVENTGSCHGHWIGKLNANDQRKLFGHAFFGRRTLHIDGENETIDGSRQVCFGMDSVICDRMDLKTGSVISDGKRVKSDFWN